MYVGAAPKIAVFGAGGPAPLTHAQARTILANAWRQLHGQSPTDGELDWSGAIAAFETGYGRIGQFTEFYNKGHINWGALEHPRNADGTCPTGFLPGDDRDTGGGTTGQSQISHVCFYVYPDDTAAATAFLKNLTVNFPSRAALILQAMNEPDTDGVLVATAMKGTGSNAYYTGNMNAYARGIAGVRAQIRHDLGLPQAPPAPAPPQQTSPARVAAGGTVLLFGAALVGATLLIGKSKTLRPV